MALRNGRRSATGFLRDFQEFIAKGNVVDLAVAVIIGGAFGKIVDSFIKDIVTPVILSPVLSAAGISELEKLSVNGIKYGVFLAAVLNFVVIAFVIFLMIRALEKFKRKEAAAEAEAVAEVDNTQERLATVLENLTEVLNRNR
ncbi:large conductance mechanosensitive channel protein MscL [Tumidithrix elongata RA019]|uniref:Large-conductance mechanosensitive channel n=1 Tax=Tumidithrix elongata BACA0141 TaxID=2716417 RepID=A0AAW9PNT5_9CYAN|nr:large conductance mechanosensitive channel protein MscL [Tumidithrix elongata RA019]